MLELFEMLVRSLDIAANWNSEKRSERLGARVSCGIFVAAVLLIVIFLLGSAWLNMGR